MPILLHGTTKRRAEQILECGPDPDFIEPGSGETGRAESFSTFLEEGPFLFGRPEDYAHCKASTFPDEGGPAILVVDVPKDIVDLAVGPYFPLEQGLVQFDRGTGLEELKAEWSRLEKQIIVLEF
jgi:hypothetical protein